MIIWAVIVKKECDSLFFVYLGKIVLWSYILHWKDQHRTYNREKYIFLALPLRWGPKSRQWVTHAHHQCSCALQPPEFSPWSCPLLKGPWTPQMVVDGPRASCCCQESVMLFKCPEQAERTKKEFKGLPVDKLSYFDHEYIFLLFCLKEWQIY